MKKTIFLFLPILFVSIANSFAQVNDAKADVALIKSNLAASKESIKKYQWIETITTTVNSTKNSVTQNQCYYDVTGKLIKVPTGATTQEKSPPGVRGAIANNKKADIEAYIDAASKKIQTYIPPIPEKIDQIYSAGGVSVQVLQPKEKFKLSFPNYNQQGDVLAISVDVTNKLLLNYGVNTTVSGPSDPVTFDITVQSLPDGTQYAGNTTFNSPSQNLKIVIENSGFTPLGKQ